MPLGQLFFGFSGRIGRTYYWGASLLVLAAALGIGLVVTVGFPASAEAPAPVAPTSSIQVPPLRGRVNDTADLLTPSQETGLEALYRSLEQDIGSQVALLTIESLHGVRIEDYSLQVAKTWKLGRRDVDDGVLITMAVEDRSVRIEVGYGLESVIPNEAAQKIIDEQMIPAFRSGSFFQGIEQGSQAIVQRIRANPSLVGKRRNP